MLSTSRSQGSRGGMMSSLSPMQQRVLEYFKDYAKAQDDEKRRPQLIQSTSTVPWIAGGKSTLDVLPLEVRRQIYGYLVVNRAGNDCIGGSLENENDGKKRGINIKSLHPETKFIFPGILYTSKRNLLEAGQIMYSDNTFYSHDPDIFKKFVQRIGSVNIEYVRSLQFWISPNKDPKHWIQLFTFLASRAIDLKKVALYWHFSYLKETCLGINIDFIRAFAQIRGLFTVELGGHYGSKWPEYLMKEMHVSVVEVGLKFGVEEASLQGFQKETQHLDPANPTRYPPGLKEYTEE